MMNRLKILKPCTDSIHINAGTSSTVVMDMNTSVRIRAYETLKYVNEDDGKRKKEVVNTGNKAVNITNCE